MVEKRAGSGEEDGPDQKRTKTAGQPTLDPEAVAKAKALLEKQRLLREKLKKLPQVIRTTAPAASASPHRVA